MDPRIVCLLLVSVFAPSLSLNAHQAKPAARITVMGVVFCDICSNNTFSRHSYFLPDVDVHIDCEFNANSPTASERFSFSVNRKTDRFGVYRLEIPSVDGFECADGPAIESFCKASLIGSSSSSCNVPGLKTTSDEIAIKSKQVNLCVYSLSALNYRPRKRNITLCRNYKEEFSNSLNSSKFFLPYFPPFGFPLPPLPQLPPFPSFPFPHLPPFPSWSFPPIPFLNPPPSLPFPFPPLSPTPPLLFPSPPPPAINLKDPRTWIPLIPASPPPPAFNLKDPSTWVPLIPASPPPPSFNLKDPRTWIPLVPTSPPPPAFNLKDPRTWIPLVPASPPPPSAFNLKDPKTWLPSVPASPPPHI